MHNLSPQEELSEIRAKLRKLQYREAQILAAIRKNSQTARQPEPAPVCRPGWPMQRLSELRTG